LGAETTFDFNKAVLQRSGKIALDKFIQDYKNSNIQSVTATGYTDSIGSDAYNKKLSLKRAQAVKAYLVSKGINKNLITIEGLGKSNPVAPNTTEQGRAKNRRVEIQIKLK
jgi:OOP family OmpA-OmpF porin